MKPDSIDLPILRPSLQVSFYYRLQTIRERYLQNALRRTIANIELDLINRELQDLVSKEALQRVASFGLRGELFFALPNVIQSDPNLLGYYRLLLGLSQKEFYNKNPFGRFKCLEDNGELPIRIKDQIVPLCKSLIGTAEMLVREIDDLSPAIIHDLQLLTLGPLLRGSENTRIGKEATREVYDLINQLVRTYIVEQSVHTMTIENDSKRMVFVEFFSDPDIRITCKMESEIRPLVSVEIKGGTDASNIHNRIGEAEKSHQKAKGRGFLEFWTIIRVDVDTELAKRESPTTSHFFHLDQILDESSEVRQQFTDHLMSILGIQSVH